jgi:hypothetical protein
MSILAHTEGNHQIVKVNFRDYSVGESGLSRQSVRKSREPEMQFVGVTQKKRLFGYRLDVSTEVVA